jgi:uncharacterized membrane protein YobD (UPF0266 family)
MKKTRTEGDIAVWSNYLFLIPLGIALYFGVYAHALILAAATCTSLVYHFNRERHYSLLDHVTAISLMFANLVICLLGGLTTFSLVILGVLSAYAFYVRWKGDRGLYALNHGLWHIASVAITIVSLGIYLL